ncbi:MAG: ABC transporter substrate-binding protein [Acetobacteraceae bacterium]
MKLGPVLLFASVLLAAPLARADEPGVTNDTIRIGMFGPLTGQAALYGNIILGSEALYKDINDHGGINGRKIKLFVEDDGCNSLQGIAAVKKLVSEDGVFLINGGVCSGVSLAAKPEILKSGLPWMVAGAAATEISTPTEPTIFQASPTAADNSREMIDFAMSKAGTDKIAIVTQSDDWGKSYHDPALAYLQSKYHIKPVLDLQISNTAMDATSQILQLRNSGAQAILAMLYPAPFAVFVRDAYKFGLTTPILGNSGVTLFDTLKRVGNPAAMRNVYIYYHLAGTEDGKELARFAAIWHRYYPDKPVNNYSYVGMAGTLSIIHVLQGLGHDVTRARFLQAMDDLHDFDSGVEAGPTSFTAQQHDGTTAGFMSRLENGNVVLLRSMTGEPTQ